MSSVEASWRVLTGGQWGCWIEGGQTGGGGGSQGQMEMPVTHSPNKPHQGQGGLGKRGRGKERTVRLAAPSFLGNSGVVTGGCDFSPMVP